MRNVDAGWPESLSTGKGNAKGKIGQTGDPNMVSSRTLESVVSRCSKMED